MEAATTVAVNKVLGRCEVDWVAVASSAMVNAAGVTMAATTTLAETVPAHGASMAALRRLHGNAVSEMAAAVSVAGVAPSGWSAGRTN